MMPFQIDNLPPEFKAYQVLSICSNHLIGGGHLLAIEKTLPIIIGKGVHPLVWIQAPFDADMVDFIPLVSASKAIYPLIDARAKRKEVTISMAGRIMLHLYAKSDEEAVVDNIDLRMIGINIFGDSTELNAAGSIFKENSMRNANNMIGFAPPGKKSAAFSKSTAL